jgi:hypothetical protein
MRAARLVLAFFAAVLATAVCGTAASTQFVLARLQDLGAEIPWATRMRTTLEDLGGMGPTYGLLVAVSFAIAFALVALVTRRGPRRAPPIIHATVGALAVLAMLGVLGFVFGTMPIAGANTAGGVIAQCLAGGIGGYAFGRLRPAPPNPRV